MKKKKKIKDIFKTRINGIKHVLIFKKGSKEARINFFVNVGARDEIVKKTYGLSHFIEHMMFRGNTKYRDVTEMDRPLYTLGATYNAQTDYDYTRYFINISSDMIKKALDIIFEMLFHSLIRKKDIEKEKGAVENEALLGMSNPRSLLLEMTHSLLFRNTPLEHLVEGKVENIQHFSQDIVRAYLDAFYVKKNFAILIESPIPSKKLVKILQEVEYDKEKIRTGKKKSRTYQKYYGLWSKYMRERKEYEIKFVNKPNKTAFPDAKEYIERLKKIDRIQFRTEPKFQEGYVAFGFRVKHAYGSKHMYYLEALGQILTNSLSSELYISLREKLGLIYYITYDIQFFKDSGKFIIYMGIFNETKKIVEGINEVFKHLNVIKKKSVSEEELENAKSFMINRFLTFDETILDTFRKKLMDLPVYKTSVDDTKQYIGNIEAMNTKIMKRIVNAVITVENCFITMLVKPSVKKELLN